MGWAARPTAGRHSRLAALAAVAALVSTIALPGASAPARAQDGVTAGTAGQSVRRLALAPVTDNPAIGNQGFTVLVKGNAALNATATGGPLALGGPGRQSHFQPGLLQQLQPGDPDRGNVHRARRLEADRDGQ